MVKIWFDVMTTKESWLFGTISRKLKKEDIQTLITVRDYDQNKEVLDIIGEDYTVIGKHGGEKLENKLIQSIERSLGLTKFILKQDPIPDYCVSLASPEALRVSFGLGIKSICVNDTPHAIKVGKLTVPLSDFLISPDCIDETQFIKLGIDKSQIIKYKGVDEFTWLKDFKPKSNVLEKLEIDKNRNFILFRVIESKSSYYNTIQQVKSYENITEKLIEEILNSFPDLQIILLSRYKDQKEFFKNRFGDRIIIPKSCINGPSVSYFADLVISGGGTMNREAAILGTPAICYFPLDLEVNKYIMKEGFPLWHKKDVKAIISTINEIFNSSKPNKMYYLKKINDYEDVLDALKRIISSNVAS